MQILAAPALPAPQRSTPHLPEFQVNNLSPPTSESIITLELTHS